MDASGSNDGIEAKECVLLEEADLAGSKVCESEDGVSN
jgi:hypothetical protein